MGSFFTNIHVRVPLDERSDGLADIRAKITEVAAADGFKISEDGGPADRTVLIAETRSPDWVVVYDESSEAMDIKALESLARAVSKERVAISAVVADSDDLELSLFRDGKRRDGMRFSPSGPMPKPELPAWSELLGDRVNEFENAFRNTVAFAEEPLQFLVRVLGWDEQYTYAGYRDRDELPSPAQALHFTLSPERRFYSFNSGVPILRAEIASNHATLVAGPFAMEGFGCGGTFVNEGGQATGMSVLLEYTPAVEEYLDIRGVRVAFGQPRQETDAAVELVHMGNERYLNAHLPDQLLPPRPVWPAGLREWQLMKIFELNQQSRLWVLFIGTPKKAGSVDLLFWVSPDHNPRDGAASMQLAVDIRAEPWWQ